MPKQSAVKHQLIWDRLHARADQPTLNRQQIVQTAIAIADVAGAEGITMRRIATELGSGAMSLYRHVFSKDDLLDLMIDEVFGEITLPDAASEPWRQSLTTLAKETRTVFKRHAWLSAVLNSRPTIGPNYMRWFECSLAVFANLELDIETTVQMVGTLYAYVSGVVRYEVAEEEHVRRTGLTEEDKRIYATPYIERLIEGGKYPNFARLFQAGIQPDSEQSFEFGLQYLLDGFAARLSLQ